MLPDDLGRTLLVAVLALIPAGPWAQTIQRCEGPEGRIVYSNAECPPGTRAVKALSPATQPSTEARQEARARAERDRDAAKALQAQREPAAPPSRGQAVVSAEEARRAADCAYLRAELDASRRLRNVLTTRRYYSTEDVEQMDRREAELAEDYRRFCSR
jgi:hypothetical protein